MLQFFILQDNCILQPLIIRENSVINGLLNHNMNYITCIIMDYIAVFVAAWAVLYHHCFVRCQGRTQAVWGLPLWPKLKRNARLAADSFKLLPTGHTARDNRSGLDHTSIYGNISLLQVSALMGRQDPQVKKVVVLPESCRPSQYIPYG